MVKSRAHPLKVNLHDIFLGLQDEMVVKLKAARKVIHHPGTKGDVSEGSWVSLLSTYLPARYSVRRAIIVDSDGNLSDAIDVVIFDRHFSPFLLHKDGATYIPSESVYAAFEVKQELTQAHLKYAGAKAASIRRLKRTSATIAHAGGQFKAVQPKEIICGILALTSTLKDPAKSLAVLKPSERLTLGCALDSGAFAVELNNAGKLTLKIFARKVALIGFFLSLLDTLQKIGSVPAMDIRAYRRNL